MHIYFSIMKNEKDENVVVFASDSQKKYKAIGYYDDEESEYVAKLNELTKHGFTLTDDSTIGIITNPDLTKLSELLKGEGLLSDRMWDFFLSEYGGEFKKVDNNF